MPSTAVCRAGSRIQGPWALVVVSLLAYSAFLVVELWMGGWDPSTFVVAGDRYANPAEAPAELDIRVDSDGYDGQFFFRLALDPFTSERSASGLTLDIPSYRQQRILYPLTVWLFARGDPGRTASFLILVNGVAIAALAWCAGSLAVACGLHAFWGSLIVFFPGYLLTASRDLSEIYASAWALYATYAYLRGRHGWAAALFVAAALTRETTLLVPIAIAVGEGLGAGTGGFPGRVRRMVPYLVPVAAGLLWQVWLSWHWGDSSLGLRMASFGPPLRGIAAFLGSSGPPLSAGHALRLVELGFVAVGVGLVGWAWARGPVNRVLAGAWLAYVALFVGLSEAMFVDDYAFMRAYTECHLLGAVLLLGAKPMRGQRAIALAATLGTWGLVGASLIGRA